MSFRRISDTHPCDGKTIGGLGSSRCKVRENMIPSIQGPVIDNGNSDEIDIVDAEGFAGIQVNKNAETRRILGKNDVSCTWKKVSQLDFY